MHTAIAKAFKKYHIFGFTGTPIFAPNAAGAGKPSARTTPQLFGDKLHTYTIVNAINDGNVLPFRIDYINTMKSKAEIEDKEVRAIDREKALAAPERIRAVTEYILAHFDQKTMRGKAYSLKGQRVLGFNSMFAVASIPVCMKYYEEFKRQLAAAGRDLAVATIFSYAANEDDLEDALPDEDFDTTGLDRTSRDFLSDAIADYNARFSTNFSTDGDSFQNYYKDLSQRMKKREIDLLIVVNMFLTGFDATTLNTLWVDKNLKYHGLIQAFSRTNRILNSVKTFGNIVAFRNLAKATDDAISLFGDENAESVVLLRAFPWQNNLDQLKRVMRECVLLAPDAYIREGTLRSVLSDEERALARVRPARAELDLSRSLDEISQAVIRIVLQEETMNQSKAATRLGISRSTLWRRLQGRGTN